MARVGVFGASGYTGKLLVEACLAQGITPVALGRDGDRVRDALAAVVPQALERIEIRTADAMDAASLRQAFEDLDVVLTSVGPFDRLGRGVLDAAIATATHYVDVTGEQSFLRWAYGHRDADARGAGIVAVPAAGFDYLPGDLLAAVAAGAVAWPDELHVTYAVRSKGGLRGASSAGTRRTIAGMLGRPGLALEQGRLVEERLGEARRLAWFPRPVGPRHAAGFAGGEPLTVPRHVAGIRTVRTYLAMPGWKAEAAQLVGNAARWPPARRVLATALQRGDDGPSPKRRRATRWACVAEARGGNGVARAWGHGSDVYGLTATAVVAVAQSILAGGATPGIVPPAAVTAPDELLDALAVRSDLRWSVARPSTSPIE